MKVLYFHQHFSTPRGAAGIRSYQMARCLLDHGHQVTMVCGSYKGGDTGLKGPFGNGRRDGLVDGIQVIEFDVAYSNNDSFIKRSSTFFTFAFKSIWLALSEEYDVLFATTTPLTAALPGIAARWLRGKRFVFEVRDLWPELPREMGVIKNPFLLGAMGMLEWAAYKSAHALIGLSPGIKQGIQRLGIASEQIAMIPNGCDLSIFRDKEIKPWRPKGVRDTDLMAIYAGTHGVANGLDALLNAAFILKQRQRNDIKLVLLGQGKLKAHLVERAQLEKLTNVVFHDPVNKLSLAGIMASADVGMQLLANIPAFYYGTSPNKFFDYISAGLPVFNNYPGWLADMVKKHGCGLVSPPDNPEAFVDALEWFADNREQLSIMGQAAHQLAESDFDRNKLAEEFVKWLESNCAPDNIKVDVC